MFAVPPTLLTIANEVIESGWPTFDSVAAGSFPQRSSSPARCAARASSGLRTAGAAGHVHRQIRLGHVAGRHARRALHIPARTVLVRRSVAGSSVPKPYAAADRWSRWVS